MWIEVHFWIFKSGVWRFYPFFYENMEANWKDEEINIFIRSKECVLIVTLLSKILEVPNKRDCLTRICGTSSVQGYKLEKWVKKLTKGKTTSLSFGNMLDKTHKLLHYFILESIYPKSGTKSNVGNLRLSYYGL